MHTHLYYLPLSLSLSVCLHIQKNVTVLFVLCHLRKLSRKHSGEIWTQYPFRRCNSAKQENDITTPQSKYAYIESNGMVSWQPSFLWSLSHCSMDSTWFPFDEQICNMNYTSWKYTHNQMLLYNDGTFGTSTSFIPNNQWKIIGIWPASNALEIRGVQ